MFSAFGVVAETRPLPCTQPEMGGVDDSPPNTGASAAWFCWTSVLAKTRTQGPFCPTITISRPAVIVSNFWELVSAWTNTGVLRRTVAMGPEGGLSAAKEVAVKAREVQRTTESKIAARGVVYRGGFTSPE